MTERYLSITKAHEYAGQTRNRMRRFVEGITKPENHADRSFIKPSPVEVDELHKNNHPFSWKISTELLDREFKKEGTPKSQKTSNTDATPAIELLEKTIGMLENELDQKNKQIAQFQERDRESNILLQQTTEKLVMLTENKKQPNPSDAVTVDLQRKEGSEPDKSSKQPEAQSLWQLFTTPVRLRKRYNK
jgi:hypothetical protein